MALLRHEKYQHKYDDELQTMQSRKKRQSEPSYEKHQGNATKRLNKEESSTSFHCNTEPMVWEKELEKKGLSNVPPEQLKTILTARIEENQTELERLRKQISEHQDRKELIEKEKEFTQKTKEAEYSDKCDDDVAAATHEPSTYLNGLTIDDLEDLLFDIQVYTGLDHQQSDIKCHHYDAQYWHDITTITKDELAKLRKSSSSLYDDQETCDTHESINAAVLQDIIGIFKSKTIQQLEQWEKEIKSKIENEDDIDISYWESLLSQLQTHLAHVRLHHRHQLKLNRTLQKPKQGHAPSKNFSRSNNDSVDKCLPTYEPDLDLEVQKKSMSNLTSDDTMINTILPMDIQDSCSNKYQVKKPRYFNEVDAGYNWNQYNQKHYDKDNPPPKTIKGYKFNIYYPDLIDKSEVPSCSLTVCDDNKKFAILKIHAGPPYQDVAFKIMNEEWDRSEEHGYRCHFRNGIFQLWFHFLKMKYHR